MTVRLFSPAKINLHLDVLRRRPDGFHDLATVFMALDWGDDLSLTPMPGANGDTLFVGGPFRGDAPSDSSNLVLRALECLRREVSVPPVHVELVKNIPAGSGLGAGSSNAAAALVGADRLFGLGLGEDRLEGMAAELGSDCAFFVKGGVQQGSGRGEILHPIDCQQLFSVVVVVPQAGVNTAEAYRGLKPDELGLQTDQAALLEMLGSEDVLPLPTLHNTFEAGVSGRVPEIAHALARLRDFGAEQVLLSGSGSACFGIFPIREEAENTVALWDLGARAIRACWPWPLGVQVRE